MIASGLDRGAGSCNDYAMTNTPTLYTRIPYRGYTMMIDRDGKTQIWSGQDCICTESTPNDARKIIDHWVDGASR